jgi:hypothetical protein
MTMVWKLELRSWESDSSSDKSVLEIIKCLSAGVVAVLLFTHSLNQPKDSPNEITFDVNFGSMKLPI